VSKLLINKKLNDKIEKKKTIKKREKKTWVNQVNPLNSWPKLWG
jgi:hypothetical protein